MPHVNAKIVIWRQLFLTLIVAAIAADCRAEPLRIAYFTGSARSKIGALIMVEVYRRAHIDTVAIAMPGARNSVEAEASMVVGESVRVWDYVDAHPALTRVEPAVTAWSTVAFYKANQGVTLNSIQDLQRYSIGYVRGTRAADNVIKEQKLAKLTAASTPEALFKMLNADRFQIALDGGTNGNYWIAKNNYQNIEKFEINRIPLYHILSPKYKYLAPALSKIIRQMAAAGELSMVAA